MSALVNFRCDVWNDRNASRLCLFGSECRGFDSNQNLTDLLEYCECAKGYRHDFVAGHFPNCGLPVNALGVMFGILTAATLISLYVALPIYLELRARARKVMLLQLIVLPAGWCTYLTLWIEQGMYEAPLIFVLIRNAANIHSLAELTLMFTAPVSALMKEDYNRMRRLIRIIEFVALVGQSALVLTAIVFCRDADPRRYNSVIAVLFAFFSGMSVTMSLVILKQVFALESRINAQLRTSTNQKMIAFARRLTKMRQINISFVLVYIYVGIFPICFFVLGSLPGQFVFLFFMFISVPSVTARGAMTLRTDGDEIDPSSGGGGEHKVTGDGRASSKEGSKNKVNSKEEEGQSVTVGPIVVENSNRMSDS
jgi:hypothetical protein